MVLYQYRFIQTPSGSFLSHFLCAGLLSYFHSYARSNLKSLQRKHFLIVKSKAFSWLDLELLQKSNKFIRQHSFVGLERFKVSTAYVLVYIFCDFFDFGSLSLRTEKASSWNFGKTKSKFLTETEKTLNMKTVFD